MKKQYKIIVITFLFQLNFLYGFSQIRTLCIKGYVVYVDDLRNLLGGDVNVGDSINGTLKYDLSISDSNSATLIGNYYNMVPPAGIYVAINARSFLTNSSNVKFVLETVNDYPSGDDLAFNSYNNLFSSISSLTSGTISWQLNDTNKTAITNTNIPTFINLGSWQQPSGLTINASNGIGDTSIFIRAIITLVDTCASTMGVSEINNDNFQLSIYPNPATDQISIEFNLIESKNTSVEIKNVLGQAIKTISNKTFTKGRNKIEIDVSAFSSGLYFIQLKNGNKVSNKKMIKE